MKILMVSDLYPPMVIGGYEIHCRQTADELALRGHEVVVLTSQLEHSISVDERGGSNVRRLLFWNPLNDSGKREDGWLRLRRRYYQLRWLVCNQLNYLVTRMLARKLMPDFIFFWNMEGVGVGPILAVQDLDLPSIFSVEDYWIVRLKDELQEKASFLKRGFRAAMTGLSDFRRLEFRPLIAISEALKRVYVEHGFPSGDIYVVPQGIHSEKIESINKLRDVSTTNRVALKLLFVGRLVPEKGPDVAINALRILNNDYKIENLCLDIFGRGPIDYMAELSRMISSSRLEKKITLKGWLDQRDLFRLYGEYDALLMLSRWEEPLSGTLLEAMASGLPVIASARGGMVEVIQDGVNGLLVPADDADATAAATYRILRENGLAKRLRVEAIKTIRNRFTLENVVDQYLNLARSTLHLPVS